MEKHWTAYLPEAGRIKRKGEDIQYSTCMVYWFRPKRKFSSLPERLLNLKMKLSIWQERIGPLRKSRKPSRKPNNEWVNNRGFFAPFLLVITLFFSKPVSNNWTEVPMPAACGFPLSVVSKLTLHYVPPYLLSVHCYPPASASRAREADSISFHQPHLLFSFPHETEKKT